MARLDATASHAVPAHTRAPPPPTHTRTHTPQRALHGVRGGLLHTLLRAVPPRRAAQGPRHPPHAALHLLRVPGTNDVRPPPGDTLDTQTPTGRRVTPTHALPTSPRVPPCLVRPFRWAPSFASSAKRRTATPASHSCTERFRALPPLTSPMYAVITSPIHPRFTPRAASPSTLSSGQVRL